MRTRPAYLHSPHKNVSARCYVAIPQFSLLLCAKRAMHVKWWQRQGKEREKIQYEIEIRPIKGSFWRTTTIDVNLFKLSLSLPLLLSVGCCRYGPILKSQQSISSIFLIFRIVESSQACRLALECLLFLAQVLLFSFVNTQPRTRRDSCLKNDEFFQYFWSRRSSSLWLNWKNSI